MKKKEGKKASISVEELFKLAEKYSKNDDVAGLLKELEESYSFEKPKAKNILDRLSKYIVREGLKLHFPALSSSSEKVIRWSIKGLTLSKHSVNSSLYQEALDKKVCYEVNMHPDLSITLKPKKQ